MELKKELLEKAKTTKSAEELLALAKENGIEITEEQAKEYFAKLNTKAEELADDELDNVSGGCDVVPQVKSPVESDRYKKNPEVF